MSNCPEFVQQATEGGFPWIILLLVALIVGGVYAYQHGIVGTEASLKGLIEKLRAKANKIEAKWAAKRAKATTVAPVAAAVQAPAAPVRTKAQRIMENNAMVASGAITKEAADAANAAILREA